MIGVDHVGILVGNGEFPRELSVERAAEVAAEVHRRRGYRRCS
jgi:hypothetical protein